MGAMRTILVIGIGVGDPQYVTVQGIEALNRVDVFFGIDKGPAKADLAEARRVICERFIENRDYRTVTIDDPPRDRTRTDRREYLGAVDDWRDERARRIEHALRTELGAGETGG